MTDAEKIKWFDDTVKWFDQWESLDEAIDFADMCSDAPYDLFFDFIEQARKVKGE